MVFLRELADGLAVHRIRDGRRAPKPATSGSHSVTVKPNEWKNGSTPTITSSGVELEDLRDRVDVREDVAVAQHHALGHAGAAAREDDRRERLGVAFVRIEPRQQPRAGSTNAVASIRAFANGVDALEHVFEEHHAVDRRDVRLREELARREDGRDAAALDRARPSPRGPAVKLRFTETLPASAVAMLASAPPTDAGSSRPMRVLTRGVPADPSRQQQRARPACGRSVSAGVPESAMQNDPQCRFADRMNWRPSTSRRLAPHASSPARRPPSARRGLPPPASTTAAARRTRR